MATLVYAELSVGSGYLRYACAGHPPPLIVPAGDESPCFAWEGRSTPLDPYVPVGERAEGDAHLQAGATVLLYTDGLIERRSHSVDEGMNGLRAEAAGHRGDSPAKLSGTIIRTLADGEHRDDVCLLAARLGEGAHSGSSGS